jgi:hypothetical protein
MYVEQTLYKAGKNNDIYAIMLNIELRFKKKWGNY